MCGMPEPHAAGATSETVAAAALSETQMKAKTGSEMIVLSAEPSGESVKVVTHLRSISQLDATFDDQAASPTARPISSGISRLDRIRSTSCSRSTAFL